VQLLVCSANPLRRYAPAPEAEAGRFPFEAAIAFGVEWRAISTDEHGIMADCALATMVTLFLVSTAATSIYIGMARREFHIVRDESRRPQFGVCERCSRKFLPIGDIWGRVEDFLWRRFWEHKCSEDDERIVVEATKLL